MRPQKRHPYLAAPPEHGWVIRAARAVLIERRMPGALARRMDMVLSRIGLRYRTKKFGEYRMTFRRRTADEAFIKNVLIDREYFPARYEPRPSDTIIDVGANIGCFTLVAGRRASHGRVIAIEPFPENVALLRRNLNQNRLANVDVLPAAVANQNGIVRLFVGSDTGMHSLKFDGGRGAIEVPSIRLEEVFERYRVQRCNFLKIDAEGAEFDFLPALAPSTWRRIERVAMEFSVPILDWRYDQPTDEQVGLKLHYGDQLVQLLQRYGFRIDAYIDCVGFRAGYIFATNGTC